MRGDERGFEGGDGLEERIDAALRRYAEAPHFSEPRVALARVHALADQEPRSRRRLWMWAAAAAAVAAMIAVAMIWMGWGGARVTSRPVQVAKSAPQGLTPSELAARHGTTEVVPLQNVGRPSMSTELRREERNAGPSTALRRKEPRRSSAQDDRVVGMTEAASAQDDNGFVMGQARRLPKQEVFPTPEPLSAQERAMVAFATQAPPEVREQVIEAQKHLGDPIEVAAIPIEALDTSSAEPQPKGKDLP